MSQRKESIERDGMSVNFEYFKPVRNKLRDLEVVPLIILCSTKIHEAEIDKGFTKGWLPWDLMLLIRWALEYGGVNYRLKQPDERILIELFTMVRNLSEKVSLSFLKEITDDKVYKYLRKLAFQQFWMQRDMGKWELSRQSLLFCNLPMDNPIQRSFIDRFQISMSDCILMSLILWLGLRKGKEYIWIERGYLAKYGFTSEQIDSYMGLLSLSPNEASGYLHNAPRLVKNPLYQLSEQTPLTRYPILRADNKYLVYSRMVFEASMGNIFYDVMKSNREYDLTTIFASILEKYVERGLILVGIKYYPERKLKKMFPESKVTDYVIALDGCTILIDVKAIEMKPIAQVNPENPILQHELRDSIVKAEIQAFELANSITNDTAADIPCRTKYYLLVITYKNLYLGGGEVFWNEFVKDEVMPELKAKGISESLIPPENMVVCSIDEYEVLLSVLNTKVKPASEILDDMVKTNSDYQTRKLLLSQHLWKYLDGSPKLPYLDEEFERLWSGLEKRIPH